MAYVTIPKDLSKIKSKVLLNLTKRQLLCFGSGALVGVPLFFLMKSPLGTSTAAMVMMIVMLPAFLLGVYEKNGQPLEVVAKNMIKVMFLRPKTRLYKTTNFYDAVLRQAQLDEEVKRIVETIPQKAGGNRRGSFKSKKQR